MSTVFDREIYRHIDFLSQKGLKDMLRYALITTVKFRERQYISPPWNYDKMSPSFFRVSSSHISNLCHLHVVTPATT